MTIDEHRKNIALAVHNLNEAISLAAADNLSVSIESKDVYSCHMPCRPTVLATIAVPC